MTQNIYDDSPGEHILAEITRVAREAAGKRGIVVIAENEPQHTKLVRPVAEGGYGIDMLWNDDFHHALHVALTGESHTYYAKFARDPMTLLARVMTHGFAFPHGRLATDDDPPLPLTAMVNFLGNHDQVGNRAFGERLAHLVPEPAAELALLLVLLTPAIPMVFMGDEKPGFWEMYGYHIHGDPWKEERYS